MARELAPAKSPSTRRPWSSSPAAAADPAPGPRVIDVSVSSPPPQARTINTRRARAACLGILSNQVGDAPCAVEGDPSLPIGEPGGKPQPYQIAQTHRVEHPTPGIAHRPLPG